MLRCGHGHSDLSRVDLNVSQQVGPLQNKQSAGRHNGSPTSAHHREDHTPPNTSLTSQKGKKEKGEMHETAATVLPL